VSTAKTVSKRYTSLNIKESLPVVKALIQVLTSVVCGSIQLVHSFQLFHSLPFFDYACFTLNSSSGKVDNTSGEVREGNISCHYRAQNMEYVYVQHSVAGENSSASTATNDLQGMSNYHIIRHI
jgi:hypothetical protein